MVNFGEYMHDDIYFDKNYALLYENIEGGKATEYRFSCNIGSVKNIFMTRRISVSSNCGEWFDIVTPYGYGGPIITQLNKGCEKSALVSEYKSAFSEFCFKNNIVSEFVRFHPIINNALDFESIYGCNKIRKTVGTDLVTYSNPIEEEFSKSCRKNIRQAINKGVSWRVVEKPSLENLQVFKVIYYSTMTRNAAADFYYFDDDYFDRCMKYFADNMLFVEALYEGKTIAAGLYFIYGKVIHIHLSGTLTEYLYLSPAYVLRYAVTLWGQEHKYKLIHHGGGRTNSADDSLYKFKKQFGEHTEFDFYIGKKIWNANAYQMLCQELGTNSESDFFPAYRSR